MATWLIRSKHSIREGRQVKLTPIRRLHVIPMNVFLAVAYSVQRHIASGAVHPSGEIEIQSTDDPTVVAVGYCLADWGEGTYDLVRVSPEPELYTEFSPGVILDQELHLGSPDDAPPPDHNPQTKQVLDAIYKRLAGPTLY